MARRGGLAPDHVEHGQQEAGGPEGSEEQIHQIQDLLARLQPGPQSQAPQTAGGTHLGIQQQIQPVGAEGDGGQNAAVNQHQPSAIPAVHPSQLRTPALQLARIQFFHNSLRNQKINPESVTHFPLRVEKVYACPPHL